MTYYNWYLDQTTVIVNIVKLDITEKTSICNVIMKTINVTNLINQMCF